MRGLWGLLLGIALSDEARAGDLGRYRFGIEAGLGGGGGAPGVDGPSSIGGFGVGRLLVAAPKVAFELGGREGMLTGDARSVGGLLVGARLAAWGTSYARLGFAHHHEVPLDVVKEQPVLASLGSAQGIRHRSGLELAVGGRLPLEEAMLGDRLGVAGDVSVVVLPDPQGPVVYGFLELRGTLGLGRPRDP